MQIQRFDLEILTNKSLNKQFYLLGYWLNYLNKRGLGIFVFETNLYIPSEFA